MNKRILFFLCFLGSLSTFAQEAMIEFGKNKLNIDEKFSFKLIIKGSESRPSINFPEIDGFKKSDKPSTTGVSLQNGKTIYTHTFTQNYSAIKEGTFKINKGNLKVADKTVEYNEFFITVFDPSKVEVKPKKVEYIEEKDHAKFELTIDKSSVFKGEGLRVSLVFLTFEDNAAELEFPVDLIKKVEQFEKKIKPNNCIEEKEVLTNYKPEKVNYNGKVVNQYKFIETTFFPIDTKTINFPALNLDMTKLKVANDGGIQKKLKINKTFSTVAQSVTVKKLPPHPSENAMLVGSFEMKEILKNRIVETGESFSLELIISGKGNFNLINQPNLENDADFDFYSPLIKETVLSNTNNIGKKHFVFNIVPKKTGIKSLDKYIQFVFFDTKKQVYDTLSPTSLIEVVGKNLNKTKVKNPDNPISIFDGLENEKIDAPYFDFFDFMRKITNVLAFIMFGTLIYLIIKNPK